MCQPWEISNRMQCVSCLNLNNNISAVIVHSKGFKLSLNFPVA